MTPEKTLAPERISAAKSFRLKLHKLTNEIEMLPTLKNRAASTWFGIAQDHYMAIVFLLSNTFYSSSFALLRPLFEAYVRGLWVQYCATEQQASEFFDVNEDVDEKTPLKKTPKMAKMIAKIEKTPEFSDGNLSRIKKEIWGFMCDYTHTGALHLQRWQSSDTVEPSFNEKELEECLNYAELFGAMAGLEKVQLRASGDTGASVLQLIQERWP